MKYIPSLTAVILVLAAWAPAAQGGDSTLPADKSAFTLFNPTPPSLMRDFSTDRPNVTECATTVDAGHFQLEFSFVEYTYVYKQGVRTDGFAVLPFNIRVGLLNNLELDVSTTPYLSTMMHSHTGSTHESGFGDTEIRGSLNLWGNDSGPTAGAVLAFVKFPTGAAGVSNHHVEGGVLLPLAVNLPAGFGLGAMAEFDINRNAANDGYGVDIVHTVTVSHDIASRLNAYIEYFGIAPVDTGNSYLAFLDTGVTYGVGDNLQLDAGITFGLSRRADDFTIVAGVSYRI